MNRAIQKLHQRRCALKNNSFMGGGLAVNPEASFTSENGVPYAENQHYSDCYSQARPGALEFKPNPELAQVAMPMPAQTGGYNIMSAAQLASLTGKRGGTRRGNRRLRGGEDPTCNLTPQMISALTGNSSTQAGGFRATRRQGCGLMRGGVMTAAQLTAMSGKRGGTRRQGCGLMRGGQCGLMRGGACGCNRNFKFWGGIRKGQHGGQCGKPEVAWLGGKRTRRQSGGRFEMDVAHNIGGDGPIAEPTRTAIPCDARAGMQNPFTATPVNPDPRAPTNLYSLTPNTPVTANQSGGGDEYLSERVPNFEYSQTMMGGGYGGNAYDPSCYRAPGSEMPVYPATSAGFHFTPSTEGGATLPDGITAFNEVIAHTARLGGARKSRKSKRSYRKKAKKSHRSRRH